MQSNLQDIEPVEKASARGFSIRARFKSIHHAANGVAALIRHEHNALVHLAATAIVLLAGCWFRLGADEWRWLLLAIGLVWVAEAFNTAIEGLCDLVHPGYHPQVKRIKDVAAGAVLLGALTAALIGATVFWPHMASAIAGHVK